MTDWEYYRAKKKLKMFTAALRRGNLAEFFETLITVYGHALCMDIASERKKLAKLIAQALQQQNHTRKLYKKHFIFLTSDGSTESPRGDKMENLQVLDELEARDQLDALKMFYKRNSWMNEMGYWNLIIKELATDEEFYS